MQWMNSPEEQLGYLTTIKEGEPCMSGTLAADTQCGSERGG